jgi:hypothetical protein
MKRAFRRRRIRCGVLAAGVGLLFVFSYPRAVAQSENAEAALRDRVTRLIERLDDPNPESAHEAQVKLINLGARVLPLLPNPTGTTSPERKKRLERIREALEQASEPVNLEASRVTIQAKGIRLSEAIAQLQKQTGNAIMDMREQLGAELTNPALDLDLRDEPFFEALDRVAVAADVSITASTGDGSIGIVSGTPPKNPHVVYEGPFRIALKQFTAVRDLQAGTAAANAQIELSWEPRLRPMLMSLKSEGLEIKDDKGQEIQPQTRMESNDVVLRPENPAVEINLNIETPQRSATKLSILSVKSQITLPAALKTFHFPSLAEENVTLKHSDVTVTLENVEIDEQVWKVNVEVVYPDAGPAFESYRQGLFNNRLWLQKADGSRFEHNGGFSNTSSDGGKLGFEYVFVDVPGKPADYQLVYETPAKVVTIPLAFKFKDVPLP